MYVYIFRHTTFSCLIEESPNKIDGYRKTINLNTTDSFLSRFYRIVSNLTDFYHGMIYICYKDEKVRVKNLESFLSHLQTICFSDLKFY